MLEPTSMIALTSMGITAFCFVGAMIKFFRCDHGHRTLRLMLLATIAGGLVAVFVPVLRSEAIPAVPFVVGCSLIVAAQVFFWGAITAHGRNRPSAAFAVDAPAALIVRGPYRFVRHPFYLAYILAFAGAATLAQSPATWLVPALLAILYSVAAWQEERLILQSPLGAEYRRYMTRTGRFVPRFHAMLPQRAP